MTAVLGRSLGNTMLWPPGSGYYFLSGVHVPYAVVMKPGSLTASRILEERNTEVQRVMLERYGGYERLLCELEAVPVDTDRFGTLYWIPVRGAEPLALVRVLNATPDAEGRRRAYFLRVPPDMPTAGEAVAWTFGMTAEEYDPSVESWSPAEPRVRLRRLFRDASGRPCSSRLA